MRVNSAGLFALSALAFCGCAVGITPVIQYGPLTVELGNPGGPSGPPTATPPPETPQILAVVGGVGQESLALIAFFPSDVYDYVLLSSAITPIGSAPAPAIVGVRARPGCTHSVVHDMQKSVGAGRHFAQLTYAKGRLTDWKAPGTPSWKEAPEQVTLSLPVEIVP